MAYGWSNILVSWWTLTNRRSFVVTWIATMWGRLTPMCRSPSGHPRNMMLTSWITLSMEAAFALMRILEFCRGLNRIRGRSILPRCSWWSQLKCPVLWPRQGIEWPLRRELRSLRQLTQLRTLDFSDLSMSLILIKVWLLFGTCMACERFACLVLHSALSLVISWVWFHEFSHAIKCHFHSFHFVKVSRFHSSLMLAPALQGWAGPPPPRAEEKVKLWRPHDPTPKGSWETEIPLFHKNLGWWNIIIWPDTNGNSHCYVSLPEGILFLLKAGSVSFGTGTGG